MIFYVVELLDDWNVDVPSWKYPRNLESPRVSSPGFDNDSKMMVINRRSTTSDLSRQLSSATCTTVSKQSVYRRLGHIGLYARRPVRYAPLTATHCCLRLTWSRGHALWIPQQWSCVMFSEESRFSLQSDSRRTLIWRAPGTRYHQENTIERYRYGGAGWLVWGGIILGSRTDLHVQSVKMTGHIYRDVILEQHVRLFRGAMGAEFLFMDDNARLHHENIVDKCLQSEDITLMDCPTYSPVLNPIECRKFQAEVVWQARQRHCMEFFTFSKIPPGSLAVDGAEQKDSWKQILMEVFIRDPFPVVVEGLVSSIKNLDNRY
ncbi:transposable element Tcb2 transposase [Trichonephila clavipes]|uniref:Transposable element Tcb2 transposase n=1 Tax=Trichonephila clavipes TaxID=2585209 RepID=A0A8X6VH19_TRICX|nr:transposable element Tcb2 transposase [Trichonephila clavipes]